MDRIIRKHLKYPLRKGAKRIVYEQAYEIYTKDEAKERNIDYKHWRECKKGDYGISDDGFVAICLNRREYKNTSNLVFPYGQGFARKTGSAKLEYLPHKKSGSYVNLSAKKNYELKAQKTQYKNFAKTYAAMVMAGHVDYNVLGKVFDVNEPQPMAKAKSLLKKEYMQTMVKNEITEVLADKNVDPSRVVDMINDAFIIAKEKNDPANMLRSAENFVDMLGMKQKKSEQKFTEIEGESIDYEEIQKQIAG